jgi:23S rRNA U2552 (ribose-2'-O)-methylase RlmE/FtsJ
LNNKGTKAMPIKEKGHRRPEQLLERLDSFKQTSAAKHASWMVQVSPETKSLWERDFLASLCPSKSPQSLGGDFYSVSFTEPVSSGNLLETVFPRWCCPVQHQWPVNPRSEKFVERAAFGLQQKLGVKWTHLQILSTSPDLKRIAVGLKGRLLQLQKEHYSNEEANPKLQTPLAHETTPEPNRKKCVMVVLIHNKGICAGLCGGALELGSGLAGGLGFLTNAGATTSQRTSRAGGKISEILLLLSELQITSRDYPHWLELGAAPGGMTEELVHWGAQVTAVDLAELAPHVQKNPNVTIWKLNANEIGSADDFSAILCDMNGPTTNSAQIVAKLIASLSAGSLIVHTLKVADLEELRSSIQNVCSTFEKQGAKILAVRHLFHNRKEVTVVAAKKIPQ